MRKMFSEKDFDRLVTTFEVVDVENLPKAVAENLKCGDVVIKATEDGKKHAYHVAYQTEDEMSLVYVDSEGIEECYYEKQKSS
jgi:uncharacterized protein YacL